MKWIYKFFIVVTLLIITESCASIVSKSSYPLTINSNPSDADISIVNNAGIEIFSGRTPATVKLKASNGFFSKASYIITIRKNGYSSKTIPVEASIDGWYFGNIVFGGLIGFLIVDPATGAMYKLDLRNIDISLYPELASNNKELKVYTLEQIPNNWKEHLVQVIR